MAREVALEELISDNAIVPQDAAQAAVAGEIVQAEPASNRNANGRQRWRNQGSLNLNTRSVLRRHESYRFTGAYDPVTPEALCVEGLCNAPADGEVGEFIGAQMTAANVVVPAVTVAKAGVGGGTVSSTDRLISCGSKCAAGYDRGTVVTLTAKPDSKSIFAGWSGACTGAQLTCTVTVADSLNVTATFAAPPTGGGGGGGGTPSAVHAVDCTQRIGHGHGCGGRN